MKLIRNGIEKVRAFELPAGIRANGECVGTPRAALVKWIDKTNQGEMFYQVYVNGQYAGSTIDSRQRQMIVPVPSSFESAVRIEFFAVEVQPAEDGDYPALAISSLEGAVGVKGSDHGHRQVVGLPV